MSQTRLLFPLSLCWPSSLRVLLILIRILRARTWRQQCLSHSILKSSANYVISFLRIYPKLVHFSPPLPQSASLSHYHVSRLDYRNDLLTVLPASALSPQNISIKMWVRHITPLLTVRAYCKDLWNQVLPGTFRYYSVFQFWPHLFATSSWFTLSQTH